MGKLAVNEKNFLCFLYDRSNLVYGYKIFLKLKSSVMTRAFILGHHAFVFGNGHHDSILLVLLYMTGNDIP